VKLKLMLKQSEAGKRREKQRRGKEGGRGEEKGKY
jgi:hypothetical protein